MNRIDLYIDLAADCRARAAQFSKVPGKRDRLIAEAKMWEAIVDRSKAAPEAGFTNPILVSVADGGNSLHFS